MSNFLTYIEDFISEIKSPDNSLTIEFFLYFSRFEYAMKRSGFSKDNPYFGANWDLLGDTLNLNSGLLEKLNIPTLIKYPPKKMISSSEFKEIPNKVIDFKTIMLSVARVRNNLFHGGKFSDSEFEDKDPRNIALLKESLIILKFIIENKELKFKNCEELREFFLYYNAQKS